MTGWFDDLPPLPAEAAEAARWEMTGRRMCADPDAQAKFLRHLDRAWRFAHSPRDPVDRDLSAARMEAVNEAAAALGKALEKLGGLEARLLRQGLERRGGAMPDLAPLEESAGELAQEYRRSPGEYDRTPGEVQFFAAEAATAWKRAFGRRPSAKAEGPFACVLNAALTAAGREALGESALRNLLRGR
ncbi:MAG: hypothetical protein ACQEUZ_07435 [Pseudomonadota bacterium]